MGILLPDPSGNVAEVYRIPVRRNSGLETRQILEEIDNEIARLTQVRNLLAGSEGGTSFSYGSNRATATPRKRRVLSPEARERIAAAQRKRWAKQKKAAAKQAAK